MTAPKKARRKSAGAGSISATCRARRTWSSWIASGKVSRSSSSTNAGRRPSCLAQGPGQADEHVREHACAPTTLDATWPARDREGKRIVALLNQLQSGRRRPDRASLDARRRSLRWRQGTRSTMAPTRERRPWRPKPLRSRIRSWALGKSRPSSTGLRAASSRAGS